MKRLTLSIHPHHVLNLRYHVVDDPPGSKIGSGGSTLLVMKVLKDLYPPEFLDKGNYRATMDQCRFSYRQRNVMY